MKEKKLTKVRVKKTKKYIPFLFLIHFCIQLINEIFCQYLNWL